MMISYSRDMALREALVKTFDGKHPCALCKQIATEKQSEKKSVFPFDLNKFEFLAAEARFIFNPSSHLLYLQGADSNHDSFLGRPPTPPPRPVLV